MSELKVYRDPKDGLADRIKYMNRRLKQIECDHSAYKMLPIWKGLFGIGWVCTQCGIIKQELEGK